MQSFRSVNPGLHQCISAIAAFETCTKRRAGVSYFCMSANVGSDHKIYINSLPIQTDRIWTFCFKIDRSRLPKNLPRFTGKIFHHHSWDQTQNCKCWEKLFNIRHVTFVKHLDKVCLRHDIEKLCHKKALKVSKTKGKRQSKFIFGTF